MTAMTGPACREIRQLLGVYVVGAIDPAERAIVDDHLSRTARPAARSSAAWPACPPCSGRVPREDVERMAEGGCGRARTWPSRPPSC